MACLPALAFGQTARDAFRISDYNYAFGTARSSAMAGAFTSLGADMASMNINPAGLGMYRSSEISITPNVFISSTTNNAYTNGMRLSDTNDKTRFGIANVGGVATFLQSPNSALKNFSLAFSYNKLADFRGVSYSRGASQETSMGDLFALQLSGIPSGSLKTPAEADRIYDPFFNTDNGNPYYWGAIMAYQTFLLNNPQGGPDTRYVFDALAVGDRVLPSQKKYTSGNVEEYSIAAGFNIQNVVYFGVSVGIQSFYYKETSRYEEVADAEDVGDLKWFQYNQRLHLSGSGANFKFGVTAQPVEGLRVGVAVHTPTYTNVDEEYRAEMRAAYKSEAEAAYSDTPYLLNSYDLNTPTRFLAGVSYTFWGRGILSVDYERTWYNKMKGKGDALDYLNDDIDYLYKATNAVRVGAEYMVIPAVAVRAGYAYRSNVYRDENYKDYGKMQHVTAGLGYRGRAFFADLAYVYMNRKQEPYRYFAETFPEGVVAGQTEVYPKEKTHNILLTLGVKF